MSIQAILLSIGLLAFAALVYEFARLLYVGGRDHLNEALRKMGK